MQNSTVWYNTIQYCTVQYSIIHCSTVLYTVVQYSIVQHSASLTFLRLVRPIQLQNSSVLGVVAERKIRLMRSGSMIITCMEGIKEGVEGEGKGWREESEG